MKLLNYLKYFFYLAYNWNLKIAAHIIKHEIRGEKKYGINSTGADNLSDLEKKGIDITHATIYMPVSYDVLELFFSKSNVAACNHFLDIGCGKARAMVVAANYGVKKISGVEISKKLFVDAQKNIAQLNKKHPRISVEIFNNDAFYFDIDDDVDCIFMFNPFDEVIMNAVMENIETSLDINPRKIKIIYINPLQKQTLLEWGYKEVFYSKKMDYLEGSIFEKE